MENASHRYTAEQVKHKIERQKNKYGWEFIFLGANIDAIETARHFGIDPTRAANYHSDSQGTQLNYDVINDAVTHLREEDCLSTCWKERIDEDYKNKNR